MIRYRISDADLKTQIEHESPGWLAAAASRTSACRKQKSFDGGAPICSRIKAVYMRLQHDKCGYCERKLAGAPYGRVEHDVEHYRPKNCVAAWPDERIRSEREIDYDFPTGSAWSSGYYLLAFQPRNYVTVCKPCNSPLKSNYFPIAGRRRGPQSDDPRRLAAERPLLLYPLGDSDDPETVLTFDGIVPTQSKRSGQRRRRAIVMIDFFELDTREELLRGRAEKLRELMLARIVLESGPSAADKAFAEATIESLQSEHSAHSSCIRSFLRLYHQDRAHAQALCDGAMVYLESLDNSVPKGHVNAQ